LSIERYEDVIFYIDLSKDFVKYKFISKLIGEFINKKKKLNVKGEFNLFFFDNEDNPIFINEQTDPENYNKLFEKTWKERLKLKSNLEKGLFYILSFIAESIRKKSKSNRIIILSDTPSDLSGDYQDALFNIISKVKYFPTFIDVIRVVGEGNRFFKDDVKLNILVSDTKGGIFYTHNNKELKLIFNQFIKNKDIVDLYADGPEEVEISQEDIMFYGKLSKKIIEPENKEDLVCFLCDKEICPVCLDVFDIPNICEECGAPFHNCCILDYTVENNVGIPFIFRCPKCNILLQLPKENLAKDKDLEEEFVVEKKEKIEHSIPAKVDVEEPPPLDNIESYIPQNIDISIPKDSPTENEKPQLLNIEDENVKIIRVGGYFGKTYKIRKKEGKICYEKYFSQTENKSNKS